MTPIAVDAVPVPAFHVARRRYKSGCWLAAENRFYRLDDTADFVWCSCDGRESIADIAEHLAASEERPLAEALAATLLALDYFQRERLVAY